MACYVAAEASPTATEHAKACGADTVIERADGTLAVQIRLLHRAARLGR